MRKCKNWLVDYLTYTEKLESPELFHLWTGLSVLSGALGRNVSLDCGWGVVFPNLYTILVAKSTKCRKSAAVDKGYELLRNANVITITAERITNASLWKALGDAATATGKSEIFVFSDELSLFLSKEETHKGVMATLTRLYSCPDYVKNETKCAGVDYVTEAFITTLLATTPTDLTELIPDVATGKGFTPRLVLVCNETPRAKRLFVPMDQTLKANLTEDLIYIKKEVKGNFVLTPEARKWVEVWYNTLKYPEDEMLDMFYGRKHTLLFKVGQIVSTSYKDQPVLEESDLTKALALIDQMESFMPTAYRAVGEDPQTKHQERILRQIERRSGMATKSQLLHDNWGKLPAKALEEVMYHLQQSGELDIIASGRTTTYKTRRESK